MLLRLPLPFSQIEHINNDLHGGELTYLRPHDYAYLADAGRQKEAKAHEF